MLAKEVKALQKIVDEASEARYGCQPVVNWFRTDDILSSPVKTPRKRKAPALKPTSNKKPTPKKRSPKKSTPTKRKPTPDDNYMEISDDVPSNSDIDNRVLLY